MTPKMASPGRGAWRLLDTGPAEPSWNIALDAALLELRAADLIPDTLRFLQYSPAAALIGRHQTVAREVREDYCATHGIAVNRRITGGGAIFFDESQLGWELIASRRAVAAGVTMEGLTRHICEAAAAGLRLLGLDACFRPRNDIEVGGRKISGTGGAWEGDCFLFQGTLLIDFDAATMARALRIPVEKLSRHEIDSARERVTWMARELSRTPLLDEIKAAMAKGIAVALGIELLPAGLSDIEERRLEELLHGYQSAAWIEEIRENEQDRQILNSVHRGSGGLIRTAATLDLRRRLIHGVMFSGDFFVAPSRAIFDLEAQLKDCGFDKAGEVIERFFECSGAAVMGLDGGDFQEALNSCLVKAGFAELGIPADDVNAISLVNAPGIEEVVAAAGLLLLPYCAKPVDCDYRTLDDCGECGECEVGEAYALAREAGMTAVSICDYEHLLTVLDGCGEAGVTAYVGCCCQAFFARRHRAFVDAGIPGVLIDIDEATCYDLRQEESAYEGRFERQTRLKLDLLRRLLARVKA